jgi:hypothetical protein
VLQVLQKQFKIGLECKTKFNVRPRLKLCGVPVGCGTRFVCLFCRILSTSCISFNSVLRQLSMTCMRKLYRAFHDVLRDYKHL